MPADRVVSERFRLQALCPESARLCLKIERFCRQRLGFDPQQPRKVLAAFSGGADSTALLVILRCLAPRLNLTVCVAHLDHGLRPESADEARSAEAFCQELGLECRTARMEVRTMAEERSIGLEEAGRILRYEFLERIRQESGADIIATGHQLNDLAEDVLMRLMRGAGWPALAGMSALDPERHLCRPLLLTPRAALLDLLYSLDLSWHEDLSNNALDTLRNRVRHEVLPFFIRENPDFMRRIASLWQLADLDAFYWRELLDPLLEQVVPDGGGLMLPASILNGAKPALRLRLYKRCLEKLGARQPLLVNLRRLDQAWQNRRSGVVLQFPGAKLAIVSRQGIVFEKQWLKYGNTHS